MNFINNNFSAILLITTLISLVACIRNAHEPAFIKYPVRTTEDLRCGKNQFFVKCKTRKCKPSDPSCKDPNPECRKMVEKMCRSGCQCEEGFLWNGKGECVDPKDCDKKEKTKNEEKECAENEEFKKCGSPCESTCQKPNPGDCDKVCEDRCFCKDGYLKNGKGTCVKPWECKEEDQMQCGENEEFAECGPKCEPTCEKPFPKECEVGCQRKCFCKSKFLRDEKKNKCVRPRKCRPTPDDDDYRRSLPRPRHHRDR